ncbi:hypothetical protein [Desulfitobacterium sp.]|uniref:hypothetical protein n=1 Tax=Desulfitobacterium sp. TaxID=49981 RepID=UPI002CC68D0C|nr:hypothetical protein [Desulfitobacterium sp.]HVJ48307.1 hypothetical protein [Desulfitobacterium sp.]
MDDLRKRVEVVHKAFTVILCVKIKTAMSDMLDAFGHPDKTHRQLSSRGGVLTYGQTRFFQLNR